MTNNLAAAGLLLSTVLLVSGCAYTEAIGQCVDPETTSGFIGGFIHGFFAPFTFVISLFSDTIAMYAVNNNGGWYDFGFILGIGGFSGGILKGRRRKKRS